MTTSTGRKVRADAKLEQLNEAQLERLRGWLEEKSYDSVVSLVRQEFGLSVGKSSVSAYWRRHVLPQQQEDDAETAEALTGLPAEDFDAATIQQARALALDALVRPFPDIGRAAKLLAMVYRAEQHALACKRLALEERRVAVREKLAAQPREQFKSSRSDAVQRDAQVCPPSTRSRSSLLEAAPAGKQSEASHEPRPASLAPAEALPAVPMLCEPQNPPRFPGYSELVRPDGEAQLEAGLNAKAQGKREDSPRSRHGTQSPQTSDPVVTEPSTCGASAPPGSNAPAESGVVEA